MYKVDQLLKPLTGIVFQSECSRRGHGLVSEKHDVQTLTTAPMYPSSDTHVSGLDSEGFGLFLYQTQYM